uniref:Transmembrane protein n=2 Tax=Panagrellus redivivus TaxID=6233 RepID=A0A7E5A239_PANRE
MDYLMDRWFFPYVPYDFDEDTRKSISNVAIQVVGWADWFCKAQDPMKIIDQHTSFFACEVVFFVLCFLTFIHAWRHGNRYFYVWIGILVHALNVENLCYWIPDLDNFWQAQGMLTFFGMRAPLYILLGIYHVFDYISYIFVSRMHLPWWAEGPAVGLGAVMLDMPYDIMGIKLVWWTWHDDDPNIYDRMNWVPWNSYYFHASFACSFVWILRLSRKYIVDDVYDWKKFGREFLCVFLAGVGAFWGGTIQFALLYHPAHDIFGIHSEYTTITFLSIYALIVYIGDRSNKNKEARAGNPYFFDELSLAICLHYLFYMVLVLIADPVNIVAEGLHQPIGPCYEMQKVQTPTGLVLEKRKYLCMDDYDEKYFDFHCLPKDARLRYENGSEPLLWYAICGTEFDNRAEYIFIIWTICILFSCIFYQWAARSGPTPTVFEYVYKRRVRRAPSSKPGRSPSPVAAGHDRADSPASSKNVRHRVNRSGK